MKGGIRPPAPPTDPAPTTVGGNPDPVPDPPLAADLRQEIDRFCASQTAPRTRIEYGKALENFLRAAAVRDLAGAIAVDSDRVVRYRNSLQARGLANATIVNSQANCTT